MNKLSFRAFLSAVCVASILAGFSKVGAAPVRFDQVVQVVNAQPGSADSSAFSQLRMAGDYSFLLPGDDDDDDKKKRSGPPIQDDRVIVETRTDIVRDDVCDCEEEVVKRRGFPKWALLGLAAIPIAFLLIRRKSKRTPTPPFTPTPTPPGMTPTPTPPGMTPTPTPPGMTPTPTPPGMTPTPTPPGMTPTPTPPGMTPTPTPPGMTPTPTPPMMTPTPPPEPVPEPMTILLFGTGLASVGMAARRKFGKRREELDEKEEE